MDELSLEQKQLQYSEFFTIKHGLNVNVTGLSTDYILPSMAMFTAGMPYAFRIASEVSSLDAKALGPLRKLGSQAADLVEFLNHQSRKIDLMMSYILHQEDDPDARHESIEFGGGGIKVKCDDELAIGQFAELKIFIETEAAAIFCLGEVIACQQEEDEYHIAFIFRRIREEDQELLVRASLHLQTAQLRERAQQQKNQG